MELYENCEDVRGCEFVVWRIDHTDDWRRARGLNRATYFE
ncbi:trans-2,3-enoyl-CoA reductase-like 2b, partial [Tachysurus ichikawai]